MLAPHLTETKRQRDFLEHFKNTLFCYIPDNSDKLPIIHSEVLNLKNQESGYGIFFTVNGFTGGKRTSETLTNINAFFVDIDYPDKLNKTPEKVQGYKNELLMDLMEKHFESGYPLPSIVVETKNGLHVYWLLEKPIFLNELNPEQQNNLRIQYRDVEEAILKVFDGDPGAKDVARVLRVPDTLHQKNPADPFMVRLLHDATPPKSDCVYSFSEIREAFLKKPPADAWAVARGENAINEDVKQDIEKAYPRLERPSFKKLFSLEAGSVPEGMRNKALLVAAHGAKESGWPMEKTFAHFTEFHGLGLREIRKTIRSAYEHPYDFGYNNEVMQELATADERKELSKITSNVLSKATKETRDTSNNAQKEKFATYEYVIAARYPNLLYKERGDFYDYEHGVYRPLQMEDVRSIIFREMLKDGLTNYRKVSSINDKIAAFKSIEGRTFTQEQENPDDNILNFSNGLLNISTYELTPHTPQYLSTSQIPIAYAPAATAPRWERFISEVSSDDPQQGKLLQEIAGYCLTTSTVFAKAFILFGQGANGKSMFTRMLAKIVGKDATSSVNLTTLTRQFGLYGIIGKKINLIDEISGNYFESNTIKGVISGETMSAEVKYRPEPLEFVPTAKLLFSVNELPKINDTTPGLYRRFIIVPFDRSFETAPDLTLEQKLTEELPGILNWAIEGLKVLRGEGRFNETERNTEAMRVFKTENSPLVEFFNLYYEPISAAEHGKFLIALTDLYSQYRQYCFDHGYKPKALANFSRELAHTRIDGYDIKRLQDGKRQMVAGLRKVSTLSGEEIVYPQRITP